MLQLDGVTKVFKAGLLGKTETRAVADVGFTVQPGEVVSLIGESGSGKTTVGRLILGLTAPTAGSITFSGTDISTLGRRGLRDYYAHVQGVFQDPFSSYNPVYKVDRVLGMIRSSYLPGLSGTEWTTSCGSRWRRSRSSPQTCSASTRISSAADSCSG